MKRKFSNRLTYFTVGLFYKLGMKSKQAGKVSYSIINAIFSRLFK